MSGEVHAGSVVDQFRAQRSLRHRMSGNGVRLPARQARRIRSAFPGAQLVKQRQLPVAMWWLLFAATVATVLFIRIRLLPMPLERDEGEYGYAGQLLLRGIPPYQLAYSMKFPGTYIAYAGAMALFGQAPTGIPLGLLIVN